MLVLQRNDIHFHLDLNKKHLKPKVTVIEKSGKKRFGFSTLLVNTDLYVVGGIDTLSANEDPVNWCQVLDISNMKWRDIADLN